MNRSDRPHALAIGSLVLLQAVLYGSRLHPGVAEGDAAELQWAGSLLGIAHSPGYAFQITLLKLFGSLPVGGDLAWRSNLMSAVFGIAGGLLLYGSVRRITGQVLAGWTAAATLAFSSVYWSHSLITEVYVVGGALLAGAVYSMVRFVREEKEAWLWGAAFLSGVVIAERPSEILILPAFAGLWYGFRGRIGLNVKRLLIPAVLLLLPFAMAVTLNIIRSDPSRMSARDEILRDSVIGYVDEEVTYDYGAGPGIVDRVRSSAAYMLGLRWNPRLGTSGMGVRISKTLWLFSGAGAFGNRLAPEGQTDEMLKGGVSIALPGLLLAGLGVFFWRSTPGWVLLGLGLFTGNLAFLLLYNTFDNLTFAVPGILGLSLLAGLGAAGPPVRKTWKQKFQKRWRAAWVLLPVMTLLVNMNFIDRNTEVEARALAGRERFASAPIEQDSLILTTYWPGMTFRYLLWIDQNRRDVSIIHVSRGKDYHKQLARHFLRERRTVYLGPGLMSRAQRNSIGGRTDPRILSVGLTRIDPEIFQHIWGERL